MEIVAKLPPEPNAAGSILEVVGVADAALIKQKRAHGNTGASTFPSQNFVTFQLRVHERDSLSDGPIYTEFAGI